MQIFWLHTRIINDSQISNKSLNMKISDQWYCLQFAVIFLLSYLAYESVFFTISSSWRALTAEYYSLLARSLSAIWEDPDVWRLPPCREARKVWARILVVSKSSGAPAGYPATGRGARPYIHWQLTSTSSWIIEISTKVVGEIGCQEIILRMFSYKRLVVVHSQ